MKKNNCSPHLWQGYKKILLIMKLSIAINLLFALTTVANTYSQNSSFTLSMNDVTVKDVIKTIEASSDYRFFYNDELSDISRIVNVEFKETNISEVLNSLFDNTGITYKVFENNLIVIAPETSIQQQRITGTVSDAATGESLPGVNIKIEGTTSGTVTDNNGRYTIDVPSSNAVLIFSYVGYNSERVETSGRSEIDLLLVPSIQSLEEVVVIGYGTVRKSDLTGSVASVSSKSFENQPVTNMTSALQGRAAGVVINNMSGAPGGQTRIRIRGANSITGGNNPLYVVDGMQLGSFNLNDLNPADVENIEILKDASATAIYGSRGANGVILITTKKGKTEKPKIDFIANFGISKRSYKYDLLDPVSYARMVNVVTPNAYSDTYIQELENGGGTDWQDEVFRQGKSQDYQLSFSGTTPRSSYYISGRYEDAKYIVINSNYKKYSFHTNLESHLTNKITLSAAAFLNRSEGFNNQVTGSLRGGVLQTLWYGPAEKLREDDGTYGGDPYGALGPNPVGNLLYAHQRNIRNNALLNTKLSYKIFEFLSLDIIAGLDANLSEGNGLNIPPYAPYGNLSANRRYDNSMGLQNSNILTFHKLLGTMHDLTVTGVFEQSKSRYDYSTLSGSGSPFTDKLEYYALGTMVDKGIGSGYSESALRSYIGRVQYVLNEKYLVTASYRADGSSKFPNNKWGYFPSFSMGWRLSEESFIKDLNLFSNLKLRGGFGVTGNQGVGAFATIPQMSNGNYAYGTSAGTYSEVSNSIGDPNLRWEQTAQTDIGIDLGFFKNRLNISADYFNKQTNDLLLRVPIPAYWGGGTKLSNVGSVENKGIELSISGTPVDNKNFSWNASFNFASYKNKVIDLGGDAEFLNSNIQPVTGNGIVNNELLRNIIGQSMGTFWGNQFLGIYQESEAAEAALYGRFPGDSKYLDLNNDYKIDGTDKVIMGHSLPKYTWGFDNILRFKNFEINLFIIGVNGNSIFNMDYALAAMRIGDSRTITMAEVTPWTPENKSNKWPSLTSSTNKEIPASSKWIQDGSFIRVKNLSLSYRVPSSVIKGAPLRLGISAQNLLTFTDYIGYDPEAQSGGEDDINQGLVSGAYPSARVFTFTLQLNF